MHFRQSGKKSANEIARMIRILFLVSGSQCERRTLLLWLRPFFSTSSDYDLDRRVAYQSVDEDLRRSLRAAFNTSAHAVNARQTVGGDHRLGFTIGDQMPVFEHQNTITVAQRDVDVMHHHHGHDIAFLCSC